MSRNARQPRKSMGSSNRKVIFRKMDENFSYMDNTDMEQMQAVQGIQQELEQMKSLNDDGTLEERAQNPDEIFLESKVTASVSVILKRQTEAIKTGEEVNNYDRLDLARHIRENPKFWCKMFPHETSCVSLHGAFRATATRRVRQPRVRHERQALAALTTPGSVNSLQVEDEDTKMIKKVVSLIQARGPTCYWSAVLHPTSFNSTVENMFLVSFGVQSGHLAVDIEPESELPYLRYVNQRKRPITNNSENQFIVSMNMDRWKEMVEALGIKEPMLRFD